MSNSYGYAFGRWIALIDLALILTAVLMVVTSLTVFFFHLIFVLLAIGAFFWQFRAFALRASFWVAITTVVVLIAVLTGETQPEELIEIPLLSTILVTVFIIASRRAQVQSQLEHKHAALERALEERNALQEALLRQAFYDALTGLPNRVLFLDRLRHALMRADRHQQSVVVLFLDLDSFKSINDRFGHATGDRLLIEFATRMQALVRAEDTVARLGGDEFTVLLGDDTSISSAIHVAERFMSELALPYALDEQEIIVTASIGIALSKPGQDLADNLLRNADHAMYRAKAKGKATFEIFHSPSPL